MVHDRLEFVMDAAPEVVFDAFHFHEWRCRWDSLVRDTQVVGGAPCPYVGAVTSNRGRGPLRGLSMRTRFIAFDRAKVAAAEMTGRSFPFTRWAASMRHRPLAQGRSLMIYTYTFETGPRILRWLTDPIVHALFRRQTRKRFRRMQAFVAAHAADVSAWQQARAAKGAA